MSLFECDDSGYGSAQTFGAAGVDARYLVADARERRCCRWLLWFIGRFAVISIPSPLCVLVCRRGSVNNGLGTLQVPLSRPAHVRTTCVCQPIKI